MIGHTNGAQQGIGRISDIQECERSQTMLEGRFKQLDYELSQLRDTVRHLEDKMSPVLIPDCTNAAKENSGNVPAQSEAPIVTCVNFVIADVVDHRIALGRMIERMVI